MDFKVYTKETVYQPHGTENVITPNIIDIYPIFNETEDKLTGAEILEETEDTVEQSVALSTIWQRGLDPLDVESGIRWSETVLGEINPLQLMEDIQEAVSAETPTVDVIFDTVTDSNGNTYLKYTLKANG